MEDYLAGHRVSWKAIAGREVEMFRCHIDPMIGPKPRNAFMPKDINARAFVISEPDGIYIILHNGVEHIVFGSNVQSLRLAPQPEVVAEDATADLKRKPGRPATISGAV